MKALKYLKKLNDAGFEAYIVGGYVRDYILKIESTDIDITTSATPKEVANIFNITKADDLGCVNIKNGDLNIDITTYRKEGFYSNRKPKKLVYVKDLRTDLLRRDFTINTLCMDQNSEIIDKLNGFKDLESKTLRVVGSVKKKFKDDPLRMLRALRLSIVLDFKIEDSALAFIISNKKLLKSLSYDRVKEEISKILISKNAPEGFNVLKMLGILDVLDIEYNDLVFCDDLIGMWAQLEYSDNYRFSKAQSARIKNIRYIIKNGKIDEKIIFKYGLYDSIVAAKILGISEKKLIKMHESMLVHTPKDLKIDGNTIKRVLSIEKNPKIKKIKETLINEILNNNLENNEDDLVEYILKKWK